MCSTCTPGNTPRRYTARLIIQGSSEVAWFTSARAHCGFTELGAYVLPETPLKFSGVHHYEAGCSVGSRCSLKITTVLGSDYTPVLKAGVAFTGAIIYVTEVGARPSRGVAEVERGRRYLERPTVLSETR